MNLTKTIESTLAELSTIQLAKQRLAKLEVREAELEDRGMELGILLFEKEILMEKIAGEEQLHIKLKALMKMRASKLETLSKQVRVAVTQINKDLDGASIIKSEIDQTIQLGYRLRVKLTDILSKLESMTLWTRLKSVFDMEYQKTINEIDQQMVLTERVALEFEDTIEQLNRLQTRHKLRSRLTKIPIGIQHEVLSHELLTAESINQAIFNIQQKLDELDQHIDILKMEREYIIVQINKLEDRKAEFLKV